MKFQYIKHGSKVVHSANSIEELPFDVQKGIGCVAYSCVGKALVNAGTKSIMATNAKLAMIDSL